MRSRFTGWLLAFAATAILAASADAQQTHITYRLYHFEGGDWVEYSPEAPLPPGGDQPGTNLWRYEYELCNFSFSTGIRELNVFFNSDNALCATFSSSTQPVDWTHLLVGPFDPNHNWRSRFRTLSTPARIAQGACAPYTVDFTWTCSSLPGAQNYDAISTSGSDAGTTVPAAPVPAEAATWSRIKTKYR